MVMGKSWNMKTWQIWYQPWDCNNFPAVSYQICAIFLSAYKYMYSIILERPHFATFTSKCVNTKFSRDGHEKSRNVREINEKSVGT